MLTEYSHAKRNLRGKQIKYCLLENTAFWDEKNKLGPKSTNIPMEVLVDGNTIDKIDEVLQHWQNEYKKLSPLKTRIHII